MSSSEKAAGLGLVGLVMSWGIFTAWMVREIYTGMNGEEFTWMVVFPIPLVVAVWMLGSIAGLLGISFYVKSSALKGVLVLAAAGLQIYLPNWAVEMDFDDAGPSSPITPFWMGSGCLWLITIVIHAYIFTLAPTTESEEEQNFD